MVLNNDLLRVLILAGSEKLVLPVVINFKEFLFDGLFDTRL